MMWWFLRKPKHHLALARFIKQFSPSEVFEIGGHHGILAKKYAEQKEISWTILEPNPSPVEGSPAEFIQGFFNIDFHYQGFFEAVVHSHLFEHIYEPNDFMEHLSVFMDDGKFLIFSVPNLEEHLKRNFTYFIGFEHSIYLTDPYIKFLLAKHGFRLIQKELFLEDHSVFYAAVRDSSVKKQELPQGLYKENKDLFFQYINFHNNLVCKLNNKINSSENSIFLFGAHAFSQYLISFGLDIRKICNILDNDPNKQEKRLTGTPLTVKSPKILQSFTNPVVILRAGVFNDEIKEDILNNINPNVEFWG